MIQAEAYASCGCLLRHGRGWDTDGFVSGVELAYWINLQVRRSGLCTSCWVSESTPDPRLCEDAGGRNFGPQDAVAAVER
ncbi:hypothetical protein AB0H07_38920 [Streptomyces sp. NPDC021354]|uniref:hypothetical protein n=1 Tax=Streptomyces sp. NPDC021354 TaxID=3154793 RepID=UPI0033D3247D